MAWRLSRRGESSSEYPTRRRGGFKIFPIIVFGVFAVVYYFSHQEEVPFTGRTQIVGMSQKEEMQLGLQSYRQVLSQSDVIKSGPVADLVRSVGERIARVSDNDKFSWEFSLINSPEINAFCLPGGKVAIYSGIIPVADNADGLAVVMGHEIGHAIARHGAERMAHEQLAQFGQLAVGVASGDMDPQQRQLILGAFGLGSQFGLILPFSRKHESEADYIGLQLMAKACFDPREAPKFWQRMTEASERGQPPEFVSTHPNHETRVRQLTEWLPEILAERAKNCPS